MKFAHNEANIKCSHVKMKRQFLKSVLRNSAHLLGLDVHLLRMLIYVPSNSISSFMLVQPKDEFLVNNVV